MKCTQERTNKYSNYTQQNNNKLLDVERSEEKIPLKVLQTILLTKVKVSSETVLIFHLTTFTFILNYFLQLKNYTRASKKCTNYLNVPLIRS